MVYVKEKHATLKAAVMLDIFPFLKWSNYLTLKQRKKLCDCKCLAVAGRF